MATNKKFKSFSEWEDYYEKREPTPKKNQEFVVINDYSGAILADEKIKEITEKTRQNKLSKNHLQKKKSTSPTLDISD